MGPPFQEWVWKRKKKMLQCEKGNEKKKKGKRENSKWYDGYPLNGIQCPTTFYHWLWKDSHPKSWAYGESNTTWREKSFYLNKQSVTLTKSLYWPSKCTPPNPNPTPHLNPIHAFHHYDNIQDLQLFLPSPPLIFHSYFHFPSSLLLYLNHDLMEWSLKFNSILLISEEIILTLIHWRQRVQKMVPWTYSCWPGQAQLRWSPRLFLFFLFPSLLASFPLGFLVHKSPKTI